METHIGLHHKHKPVISSRTMLKQTCWKTADDRLQCKQTMLNQRETRTEITYEM